MNLIIEIKSLICACLIVFVFSGCSNKNTESVDNQKNNNETIKLSENNFTESDEDLFDIDYREFYDELSASGNWIQVNGKELGLDIEKGTASGEFDVQKDLFNYIFGLNNAYALDDFDVGMFFVWKPSPNLAVSIVADEPVQYIPYYNGQWTYTDAGWYFRAPTPAEEIVHHYGRWVYYPAAGWVWIPGRVWAPAWVDWRESNNYVSWAPIPAGIYVVNNVIPAPVIDYNTYIVVEKKHFIEPYVYKFKVKKNAIVMREMIHTEGIVIVNNTLTNRGPNINIIETVTNKRITEVKLKRVKNRSDVIYTPEKINVYSPEFRKVKNSRNKKTITSPSSFVTFKDGNQMKEESNLGKDKNRNDDNIGKDGEKSFNKSNGADREKENKSNEDINKGKQNEKPNKKESENNNLEKDKSKVDTKNNSPGNVKDGGKIKKDEGGKQNKNSKERGKKK